MSETVRYKGVLSKVPRLKGESFYELCVRTCVENRNNSYEFDPKDYDNAYEMIHEELWNSHTIIENQLYKIEKEEMDCDFEFYEANRRFDGKIEFHVMYYNGGCGLTEAIEEAVKNIKEN